MAATQSTDYYYNNNSAYQIYHHHQSQPQNFYGYATGQYDCKNLNVNDAYNASAYNSPNNYNDQWSQHFNAIPSSHQQPITHPPHYHHQHLNMLNNQINDDYKNYYNTAASKPIPSAVHHHPSSGRSEHQQPNLNCNQYADAKNDLFYGQQQSAAFSTPVNEPAYPSSQSTVPSRKRKIDSTATDAEDSPTLRALLTHPAKKVAKSSAYAYNGSISPASSTDNYPQHYQLPSAAVTVAEEQLVNLDHYHQVQTALTKEGYELSIDDTAPALDRKFCAASLFAPSEPTNSPMSSCFMENISTPPTSPKDVSKNDESCELWPDQNGGLCEHSFVTARMAFNEIDFQLQTLPRAPSAPDKRTLATRPSSWRRNLTSTSTSPGENASRSLTPSN